MRTEALLEGILFAMGDSVDRSTLSEALEIKAAEPKANVLVMGMMSEREALCACREGVEMTVFNARSAGIAGTLYARTGKKPRVHIIATGGTIAAAAGLVESLGGEIVRIVFLMELAGLKGREKLPQYDVRSVICYEGK